MNGFKFFRRRKKFDTGTVRVKKIWHVVLKSTATLFLIPIPITATVCCAWYFGAARNGFHFSERMEAIVTSGLVPTFGVLYALLVSHAFGNVWKKYEAIRKAIKEFDYDTFFNLRDEEMSPLIYILVGSNSFMILAAFVLLKYPDWQSGAAVIGSITYMFSLIFVIIKEIDEPCAGIWFIRNIHPDWLNMDAKQWRAKRQKQRHDEFAKINMEFTGKVERVATGQSGTTKMVIETVHAP